MRAEYTLDATHPQFTCELTFFPSTIIILNNTDKSVYLNVGRTFVPSTLFFDREILPTSNGIPSNVALPNNSYQFAGFLPTPTDATKNVKIIFQGTANPFNNKISFPTRGGGLGGSGGLGSQLMGGGRLANFAEYRLNSLKSAQVADLYFMADMVFILNNTDAWLYLNQGGTGQPNATYNDLRIPPTSYTILTPHGGWQYGMFLDSATQKDCWVIFVYGFADEYMRLKEQLGQWDWYLPPLVIPGIEYYFDFTIDPVFWCYLSDFTATDDGWTPGDAHVVYVPASGWVITPLGGEGGFFYTVSNFLPTIQDVVEVEVDFVISGAVGSYDIAIQLYLGGVLQGAATIASSVGNGTYNRVYTPASPITADEVRYRARNNGTLRVITLQDAITSYYGVPFITPNC